MKISICDDNENARDALEKMVQTCVRESEDIKAFSCAKDLMDDYNENGQGDIIFMDIKLKEDDGIQVAKLMQEVYPGVKIIFITGDVTQSENIFAARPTGFLIKPVTLEKVRESIRKAIEQIKAEKNYYITLQSKKGIVKFLSSDIYYVESIKRTVKIYEKKGVQTIYMKLDDFMEAASGVFLRCHKSYAVCMDKIKCFSAKEIELCDGKKVPVSRARYKAARAIFWEFCKTGTEFVE